ncbi:Hypothetical predicted protein [Octopus vulgaris]|uniref:VWFD domain-containing protein n=1 Tax=Octopus vulgaris TaxID=6645 RepID=A0AA36BNI1_OCTVU|nr:Hypothetical predicted protein [Octopus vulgaris]
MQSRRAYAATSKHLLSCVWSMVIRLTGETSISAVSKFTKSNPKVSKSFVKSICLRCHIHANCVQGKCKCTVGYVGDGVHTCIKEKCGQTECHNNAHCQVDGKKMAIPYKTSDGMLNITIEGQYMKLEFGGGLIVRFDGVHKVVISLAKQYANNVEGICGDCDSNPANDIVFHGKDINGMTNNNERYEKFASQFLITDDSDKPAKDKMRIFTLFCCKEVFDKKADYYNIALNKTGYNRKIGYLDISSSDYTDKLKLTINVYGLDFKYSKSKRKDKNTDNDKDDNYDKAWGNQELKQPGKKMIRSLERKMKYHHTVSNYEKYKGYF